MYSEVQDVTEFVFSCHVLIVHGSCTICVLLSCTQKYRLCYFCHVFRVQGDVEKVFFVMYSEVQDVIEFVFSCHVFRVHGDVEFVFSCHVFRVQGDVEFVFSCHVFRVQGDVEFVLFLSCTQKYRMS